MNKVYNFEAKSVDSVERSITHYISTETPDRDQDIVFQSGIDTANYRKNPVVLFNHNKNFVVGRNAWLKIEGVGTLSKTIFAETPLADDTFLLHKGGFLNAWSIGFMPKEYTINAERGGYDILKSELLEYSSVSVPANPEAIDEAKSMVKSIEMRDALFTKTSEIEIKKVLSEMRDDITKLFNFYNELKEVSLFDDIEKAEKDIEELKNNIETINKHIQTRTKEGVGSLDRDLLRKVLKEVAVGELSKLTGKQN